MALISYDMLVYMTSFAGVVFALTRGTVILTSHASSH